MVQVKIKMTGGQKAADHLKRLAPKITATAEIGFMANARYPDGTRVALVAAFNEFGVPSHSQPPRPFMRPAFSNNWQKWADNIKRGLPALDYDGRAVLEAVAKQGEEDIQHAIRELTSPPLSPRTIARKAARGTRGVRGAMGPAKPLIDTGHMLNSVTSHVTRKPPSSAEEK